PSLFELSLRDWSEVLSLGLGQAARDNLGLVAAGVAFYAFLALVPLLLAVVLIYGLVVEPATVARHVAAIAEMMPDTATAVIEDQLQSIVEGSGGDKGFGLVIALALALFSARNGATAVI